MLEVPLWVKILFTIWVIAFIFIEAAWDPIWEWVVRKFRSFTKSQHVPHRLKRKPG